MTEQSTTTRERAIEAGWQAWHSAAWDTARDAIAAVVDAVTPIIRADEQQQYGRQSAWVEAGKRQARGGAE